MMGFISRIFSWKEEKHFSRIKVEQEGVEKGRNATIVYQKVHNHGNYQASIDTGLPVIGGKEMSQRLPLQELFEMCRVLGHERMLLHLRKEMSIFSKFS